MLNCKENKTIYPINSKITRGLNFFFFQKLRIIFECGLFSSAGWIIFFFLWLETNAYSSIKKSSSWWFSAAINWFSAVVRVSKYSKSFSLAFFILFHAVNIFKIHKFFVDINRVRIKIECGLNSFFHPKIADYNRVRIIIECGLFSS